MIAVASLGAVSSYHNYPGALALQEIHTDILQCQRANITIHIEPAAAMTGVTRYLLQCCKINALLVFRFLQYHDNTVYPNVHVSYSKQEDGDIPYDQFAYIVSGQAK